MEPPFAAIAKGTMGGEGTEGAEGAMGALEIASVAARLCVELNFLLGSRAELITIPGSLRPSARVRLPECLSAATVAAAPSGHAIVLLGRFKSCDDQLLEKRVCCACARMPSETESDTTPATKQLLLDQI
jgi:hypothetical protein